VQHAPLVWVRLARRFVHRHQHVVVQNNGTRVIAEVVQFEYRVGPRLAFVVTNNEMAKVSSLVHEPEVGLCYLSALPQTAPLDPPEGGYSCQLHPLRGQRRRKFYSGSGRRALSFATEVFSLKRITANQRGKYHS